MPSPSRLRFQNVGYWPKNVVTEKGTMIVRAKNNLSLSRAQAAALARLIQAQLYAYDEAIGEERTRRNASQPFTGSDLDLIEPLLALLKEEAQQEKA